MYIIQAMLSENGDFGSLADSQLNFASEAIVIQYNVVMQLVLLTNSSN